MVYEIYCPDCPDCGTEMKLISPILVDYNHDDNDYYDISCRSDDLFQCPNCKTVMAK
jgi:hypothetical protein